jgi:hypothetical protein
MPRIFICYRRNDTQAISKRVYDSLTLLYDNNEIFFDEKTIIPSQDFKKKITESLAGCDVVAVMIGKNWHYDDAGNDYFSNDDDYVNFELSTALRLQRKMVLIITGGASQPNESTLPSLLKDLAKIHTAILRDDDNFNNDFKKIKIALESVGNNGNELENYIPRQSSDFLRWLENFETKCIQYQGFYGIDTRFVNVVGQAKQWLTEADSTVIRASEKVADALRKYQDADRFARAAQEKLTLAEADLRKSQDEKTQAAYRAVSEVSPLSERIRIHGDMSENKCKEFGISGNFKQTITRVVAPSHVKVKVKRDKLGMFSKSNRIDRITWNDDGNPEGTTYIVEASEGTFSRGNPVWDSEKFSEIAKTSVTEYERNFSDSKPNLPHAYRIRAICNGVRSECSSSIVAF